LKMDSRLWYQKKNLSENNHSLMERMRHNRIPKPCQIETAANDTVEK
jgi:hypothetical protein